MVPALCWRCRRETLPDLSQPSWHKEKHRAAQAEREPPPSPAALKAMRRKARKSDRAKLRKQLRVAGMIGAARFFCEIRGVPAFPPPSEDCPECLKLQADRSAKSAAA